MVSVEPDPDDVFPLRRRSEGQPPARLGGVRKQAEPGSSGAVLRLGLLRSFCQYSPRPCRRHMSGIETSLPVPAAAARAPRGAGGLRAAEGYRVHEHLVSRAAPPAGPPALPPARPPALRHPAAAAASAAGGAVSLPGARFVPGAAELGGRHGVQHGPGDDPCGFSGMYWY